MTKCEKPGNEDVYTACGKIEDIKGPFGVCLPKSSTKLVSVDPAGALHECIFDYCLEKTKEMSGNNEMRDIVLIGIKFSIGSMVWP